MSKLIIGACALLLCFACDKSKDAPAPAAKPAAEKPAANPAAEKPAADPAAEKPAADPGTAEPAAAPGTKAWIPLEKLGVQIEMPAGSKANPGAGDSFLINSPQGGCTVMLNKKSDTSYFPSYDSTVQSIEKGVTGKLKTMGQNDKKDDKNWVIQFEREDMIDPTKSKYGVDVRVVVGDGEYSCSRVSSTPEDAACVLAACLTLKAI